MIQFYHTLILLGNAVMTLRSKDNVKVLGVRGTSFPAASLEGSAPAEDLAKADSDLTLSEFIKQELAKSDRPELTAAKI